MLETTWLLPGGFLLQKNEIAHLNFLFFNIYLTYGNVGENSKKGRECFVLFRFYQG